MQRLPWAWDYDIDLLDRRLSLDRLRDWAAARLLDYAPWPEIGRRRGLQALVRGWPNWRGRVPSATRRGGLDFPVEWLPRHRADLPSTPAAMPAGNTARGVSPEPS